MSLKKRISQTDKPNEIQSQKTLIQKLQRQKHMLQKIEDKICQMDHKIKKVSESNARNTNRVMRHRARLQQLQKARDHPQILLAYSGIMNEFVQAFMISHNFQMDVDVTTMNPDHMSYEQLIELGQKIGKVSKGLTKQQIQRLDHIKNKKKEQACPICCNQFQFNQIGIALRCKHMYHQDCIIEWLKDQNKCPICKQYVLKQQEQ